MADDLKVLILKSADGDVIEGAIPLRECFPGDLDGYAEAKDDLIRYGLHRGGGGASPEYLLKLVEIE